MYAKGRIETKKDGSVIENLTTAQILIEDGAYFKGSILCGRSYHYVPLQSSNWPKYKKLAHSCPKLCQLTPRF